MRIAAGRIDRELKKICKIDSNINDRRSMCTKTLRQSARSLHNLGCRIRGSLHPNDSMLQVDQNKGGLLWLKTKRIQASSGN